MTRVDWTRWSAIAEILSAIAILITLFYLAIQTRQNNELARQTQAIATVQNVLTFSSNRATLYDSIANHSDVWVRGNAGEELPESEAAVYEMLVRSYSGTVFFNYLQDVILRGTGAEENVAVTELAYFLAENPAAYETWEKLEQRASAGRELLPEDYDTSVADAFQQVVRSHVRELIGASN